MATFSDARAIYGLSATATPTSTNASGSIQVGVNQTQVRLADANVAYSLRAVFSGAADELVLDHTTGSTAGSTSFVAGTAQVETATVIAASGITGSGNATVTVTAAGMTGSPKAISVALTTTEHTTATLIATAIAAALNADTAYSALFTATSSGADIITTRKSLWSGTPNLYPANDSTLNVAIANGTCTGITTAATSTNTTAGVASTGVKIYDGDGKDVEGETLATLTDVNAILVENTGDSGVTFSQGTNSMPIVTGCCLFMFASTVTDADIGSSDSTTAADAQTEIKITIIGKSA